jgi:hypothetical protein
MRLLVRAVPVGLILLSASVASAATLTVSAGPNNPATASVSPGATGRAVLQLNLAVSGGYWIRLTSLRLNAQGTLDDLSELAGVRLYADNGNGSFDASDTLLANSAFAADDGAADFSFTWYLSDGASENWWVVYDLSSSATPADTFRVGFISVSDVTAQYAPG